MSDRGNSTFNFWVEQRTPSRQCTQLGFSLLDRPSLGHRSQSWGHRGGMPQLSCSPVIQCRSVSLQQAFYPSQALQYSTWAPEVAHELDSFGSNTVSIHSLFYPAEGCSR